MYGFYDDETLRESFPLTPALAWKCRVCHVKDYPKGAALGYGRTFVASRPTRIAVLPIGYADGYSRLFSNRAAVLLDGRRASVVGYVSMDYTLVDATDLPTVAVGDIATLIGADGGERIDLEELACFAGGIPYNVATEIGRRVGRIYRFHNAAN
jgi:alanine racemase